MRTVVVKVFCTFVVEKLLEIWMTREIITIFGMAEINPVREDIGR